MPYNNLPESMWGKMDDCVKSVMADGKSKENAIAICYSSMMGKKSKFKETMKTIVTKR